MKVIITKEKAKQLLENIQSNFDVKGAALELEAKAISQRLGRRLHKLCDASFRLTMHTDFTKRMVKEGKISDTDFFLEIEDDRSMMRVINQLDVGEIPCPGYKDLKKFCNQDDADSMIVSTDQLDVYINAQNKDYSLYDFYELRYRTALAAREQIKLFKKLRLYKSVVGHCPIEKKEEDDKPACLDKKIEKIAEKTIEHQADDSENQGSPCIDLSYVLFFGLALGAFGYFLIKQLLG